MSSARTIRLPGARGRNAGAGRLFTFHGAFQEKADAVKKEAATPGSFIRTVWYRTGPRYAVLSKQNPRPVTAYGVVTGYNTRGRKWQQEHYESKSGDARIRAAQLRKLGFKVSVSSEGAQVTPVGTVRMTMITVDDVDPEKQIPAPDRVERMNPEYSGDPRWTVARFPSKCKKCGRDIKKGEQIFYYPRTKTVYCNREDCGKQAARDFGGEAADERFLRGNPGYATAQLAIAAARRSPKKHARYIARKDGQWKFVTLREVERSTHYVVRPDGSVSLEGGWRGTKTFPPMGGEPGLRAARVVNSRQRNVGPIEQIGPGKYRVDNERGTILTLIKKPWGWEVQGDNVRARVAWRGAGVHTFKTLKEVEARYKAFRGISGVIKENPRSGPPKKAYNPKGSSRLTVPERHQLKIARDTLRMPDAMAGVMGGPSKAEAREIFRRLMAKARGVKNPKVELVQLRAGTGRKIRKATRVTFEDGQRVTFTERLPKAKAIAQARAQLAKDARENGRRRNLQLQGMGNFKDIPVSEVRPGMRIMFNYGIEYDVLQVEDRGASVKITMSPKNSDKIYTQTKRKSTRVVAYYPKNPRKRPKWVEDMLSPVPVLPTPRRRPKKNQGRLIDLVRPGDRVTILTPHGNRLTGRAVMRSSSGGWVLNLGGPHGTPGIATDENTVKVTKRKQNAWHKFSSEKKIRDRLAAHAARTKELIAQGMDPGAASKQALKEVTKRRRPKKANSVIWGGTRRNVTWGKSGVDPARDTAAFKKAVQQLFPGKEIKDLSRQEFSAAAKLAWEMLHGSKKENPVQKVPGGWRAVVRGRMGPVLPSRRDAEIYAESFRNPAPRRRRNAFQEVIKEGSRQAVISANQADGPYWIRLYVNNGETATLLYKKAKTIAGARKIANKMLEPYRTGNPRRRRNYEDATDLYTKFHGKEPDKVTDTGMPIEDYANHPELGQLGKLVSITFGDEEAEKPWKKKIEWQGKEAPDLAAEPGGAQLYIIGGNQDLGSQLESLPIETDKEMLDLGFAYQVEYFTRKAFDNHQPVTYYHDLGEETGDMPRLVYDRTKQRIHIVGGAYKVKPEGIVN